MLKIAFLGLADTINFNHFGGLDSLARRLALSLAGRGDQVDFIHYGAIKRRDEQVGEKIAQKYFRTLNEAFEYLEAECDHVVSFYLKPKDRFLFARFRQRQEKSIRFHHVYSVWHESRIKRELLFAEARLFPFNGCLFCLSPRIYRYVSTWAPHSALLRPSVPVSFFCDPRDKPSNGKIRVTFAGRVDPGKGIIQVVDAFERLAAEADIETKVCGYAWPHEPETLKMHGRLLAGVHTQYESVDYKQWTPSAEDHLRQVLRETDVLLLPYQKLSSTIDTPLLLLEGMASLCAVITPPLGDLHEIYGRSGFNLPERWNAGTIVDLIKTARNSLPNERKRVARQSAVLRFDAESVAEQFRESIRDND
jgi:glycosyltransferase involved in cell wall biosynthesis